MSPPRASLNIFDVVLFCMGIGSRMVVFPAFKSLGPFFLPVCHRSYRWLEGKRLLQRVAIRPRPACQRLLSILIRPVTPCRRCHSDRAARIGLGREQAQGGTRRESLAT